MKTISRAITMTLERGDLRDAVCLQRVRRLWRSVQSARPLRICRDQPVGAGVRAARGKRQSGSARRPASASIVGMWKFQLISKGNTGHNPSIPDGALIDFGYTQWHSDGTEIQNSAGVPGGGFCLGVWGQTGFLTFELNHFPIAFNPTSGKVANYINLREQVTLSPSGDSFTGTFTEDIYDPKGNHVDHAGGNHRGDTHHRGFLIPQRCPVQQLK